MIGYCKYLYQVLHRVTKIQRCHGRWYQVELDHHLKNHLRLSFAVCWSKGYLSTTTKGLSCPENGPLHLIAPLVVNRLAMRGSVSQMCTLRAYCHKFIYTYPEVKLTQCRGKWYDEPHLRRFLRQSLWDLIPIMLQRMTHTVKPFRSNGDQIPNRNSHKGPIYGLKDERNFYYGSLGIMNLNMTVQATRLKTTDIYEPNVLFWYSEETWQFISPDCAIHDKWILPLSFVLEPIKVSGIQLVFWRNKLFLKLYFAIGNHHRFQRRDTKALYMILWYLLSRCG